MGKKRKLIFGGNVADLEQYVVTMADEMGLRTWRFQVKVGEIASDHVLRSTQEAGAQIEPLWANRSAVITLAPNWSERPPEDLRETVCHEMVHAHLSQFTWTVNMIEDALGTSAFQVFEQAMHIADEYATEAIAIAWAERLPLPVETKGKT